MNNPRVAKESAGIFLRASNYIRTYGWQVTGMGNHGSPRCSMGALESAHKDKLWDKRLAKYMYEELYRELDGISLTDYNYLYRDGEKVAVLFEKVAKKILLSHEQAARKYADGHLRV